MEFVNRGKALIKPNLISVTREEILKLCPLVGYTKSNGFVEMNSTIYHLKRKNILFLLNELIGEIISEYFELQTKKSIIVQDETDFIISDTLSFALISKVFFESGLDYLHYDDFKDVKPNVYEGIFNLSRLNKFWDCNIGEWVLVDETALRVLKNDLKKLMVRDYSTKQKDRTINNFMFGYIGNNVKLMPVYDYEHSFANYTYDNLLDLPLFLESVREYIRNDYEFQSLFHKLMDFEFSLVTDKLEEQYGIILNNSEKEKYNNVIEERQRLVREKKILG